ncbi:MAG: 50S ribosomal protein L9 [Acholeplasmataceae bacterium]
MKRWIYFALTSLFFVIAVIIHIFELLEHETMLYSSIVLIIGFVGFFSGLFLIFNYQLQQKIKTLQNRLSMWTKLSYHLNQVGDEIFNELPIGIIAVDEEFEIKWANPHAKTIFDPKMIGKDLVDISPTMHQSALASKVVFLVTIKEEVYEVQYRPEHQFFYLFNVSEREKIKDKYSDHIPALAIIYLDNLDETLASLDVSEQSSLKGDYLGAIADWVERYNGYLKPYGDERMLVFLYRKQLRKMIEDKFDVLDRIRLISSQNQLRVSASIGVSSWDVSYEEQGVYAQNAIELAEKRGGDQVVVNIQDEKIVYFGAKQDVKAKSSRVSIRINAQTIKEFIEQSSTVIVMGHTQTDLDAFGSMLAVYHMAKMSKKQTLIVVDKNQLDQTVSKVYQHLMTDFAMLKDRFITSEQALEMMTPDHLLIVVDSQSPRVVMNRELLDKASKLIVIDHHRASEEGFNASFSYVEPSASSTVELVMELINFYKLGEDIKLLPIEASIMYGGLVVDTNNFTTRTGARTFEVASKLKELGADAADVKIWLRRDLLRTIEISRLLGQVEVFLDRFAFVVTEDIYEDRVLLAQVSDAAMQINGIDASFTIVRIDENTVGVSARSIQDVNVQLLMEYIGGGGHLNSAAAQVKNKTIEEVFNKIKESLTLEYGSGGETMKVILLEDVKGRGTKNQIIEVANGFGQFLISQNKALLATDEAVNKLKAAEEEAKKEYEKYLQLMNKLKSEIDNRKITLPIQTGQDGKLFGSITTKQIAEQFEKEHSILIDRKKIDLQSEINSIGIYTASVTLYRDIRAQFEIHIVEK